MAAVSKTFSAEHVVAAPPWEAFEMLVDEDQQAQWRERHQPPVDVVEDTPYTRVVFSDGLIVDLTPEGSGTLLTCTRTHTASGLSGRIGLLFQGRNSTEYDMLAQIKRMGATLEHGAI